MAALLGVRIVVFVALTVVLFNWPILYVLGTGAFTVWALPVAIRNRMRGKSRDFVEVAFAQFLQNELSTAREEIVRLREEIEEARRSAASGPLKAGDQQRHSLYRRVGLDPDCPSWLISGAQKSYRVMLHPDQKPEHLRLESERRFKDMEQVFGEIRELRGC